MNAELNEQKNKKSAFPGRTAAEKCAVYRVTVAVQALAAAVLWTLAFLLDFEADPGYFRRGSFLVAAAAAFTLICAVWAVSAWLTLRREALPQKLHTSSATAFLSSFEGFVLLFDGIYRVILFRNKLNSGRVYYDEAEARLARIGDVISVLSILFCLGAAFFFVADGVARKKRPVLTCLFPALLGAVGLFELYFDMGLGINVPEKILCELGLIAVVLFFLAQTRMRMPAPYPRPVWYAASGLLAMLMAASAGISLPVFYFARPEVYEDTRFAASFGIVCMQAVFLFVSFLYITACVLDYLRAVINGETDDAAAAEADPEGLTEEPAEGVSEEPVAGAAEETAAAAEDTAEAIPDDTTEKPADTAEEGRE